jgi:hypothetical protein
MLEMWMTDPLGVLATGPATTTTEVEDVDGGSPGGAADRSGSDHHRSWRHRWWAPWGVLPACPAVATTKVGDVDDGPPEGCCQQV